MVLERRKFFNEFVLTYGKTTYCTHNAFTHIQLIYSNTQKQRILSSSSRVIPCIQRVHSEHKCHTATHTRFIFHFGSIELAMRKITTHRHPFVTKNSSNFFLFFALKNLTSLPLSILEEGFIQFLQRKFQLHFLSIFFFLSFLLNFMLWIK